MDSINKKIDEVTQELADIKNKLKNKAQGKMVADLTVGELEAIIRRIVREEQKTTYVPIEQPFYGPKKMPWDQNTVWCKDKSDFPLGGDTMIGPGTGPNDIRENNNGPTC